MASRVLEKIAKFNAELGIQKFRDKQPKNQFDYDDSDDIDISKLPELFKQDPLKLIFLGGKCISVKSAMYIVLKSQGMRSKDALMHIGADNSSGSLSYNIPHQAKYAVLDQLGMTEAHIINTIHDASVANKTKYIVHKGEIMNTIVEPDYEVRLQAVGVAAKIRGMLAPTEIKIDDDRENMTHAEVIAIINKDKKVEPNKYQPLKLADKTGTDD